MKPLLLLLTSLLLFTGLSAQELAQPTNAAFTDSLNSAAFYYQHYHIALKFGTGATFSRLFSPRFEPLNSNVIVSNPQHTIRPFSNRIAFQKRRKQGDLHEFSINEISIFAPTQITFGNRALHHLKRSNYALAYSYFLNLNHKSPNTPIALLLGASLEPYIYKLSFTKNTNAEESSRYIRAGLRPMLIPRIAWYPKFRIFADLSLPLTLLDFNYYHYRFGDPSIGIPFQKVSGTRFIPPSFYAVSIVLSAGFKF